MPGPDPPRRLGRAALWSFTMQGGEQVLGLGFTFLLAGLLGPEVFGLSAMAMVYVTFVDLLQRQGMAAALIQRKELTDAHKDSGFWLVAGTSAVLTVVSIAGAGWWARVNGTPALEGVIVALSPLVVLAGLSTVQQALLQRAMAFKPLALRTLAAVAVGGVVGLVGAALGWGVYALVAQQLTMSSTAAVILWSVSGWRPRFRFSTRAARDLLGFSTGAFTTSLAVFVNNRADALLIGLFFGPTVVGVYRLGSRLVDAVVSGVSGPIRTVALPELAPHQDDSGELRTRLLRLSRMGAAIALPALGVLAATAQPLTAVLGTGWQDAGAVIQVLCTVGVVRVVVAMDGPLLQAIGSPFLQAAVTTVVAIISAGTFTATGLLLADAPGHVQALGVACGRAVVFGLPVLAIHRVLLRRYAGIAALDELRVFGGPLLFAATAAVAGNALSGVLTGPAVLRLLAVGGVAAAVSAVAVVRVARGGPALPGRTGLAGPTQPAEGTDRRLHVVDGPGRA